MKNIFTYKNLRFRHFFETIVIGKKMDVDPPQTLSGEELQLMFPDEEIESVHLKDEHPNDLGFCSVSMSFDPEFKDYVYVNVDRILTKRLTQ